MPLILHLHPLSSYCWKALIALYEAGAPFEARRVDLGEAASRDAFLALWPIGKMPVLEDRARGRVTPETSIIIEYLDRWYPGEAPMLPAEPEAQLEARLWDRLYDTYVHLPTQKAVAGVLTGDPALASQAEARSRQELAIAYGLIEKALEGRAWAAGEAFTIADCAAAPALFYARTIAPFPPEAKRLAAYFERLVERPSFARVLDEARPWFSMFPLKERLEARFAGGA